MKKIVINYEKSNLLKLVENLNNLDLLNEIIILKNIKLTNEDNYINYISKKAYENIKTKKSYDLIYNKEMIEQYLSHYSAWEYMVANNISECIIMEDYLNIIDEINFKFNIKDLTKFKRENNKNKIYVSFDNYCERIFSNYRLERTEYCYSGMKCYYLNLEMANFLILNIKNISYPINYEVGLLSKIIKNDSNILFYSLIDINVSFNKIPNYLYVPLNKSLLKKILFNFNDDIICKINNFINIKFRYFHKPSKNLSKNDNLYYRKSILESLY